MIFHAKICINAVRMHSPMALHFFKPLEYSSLVHFIQTCLTLCKNLHYLSLLAHQEVGPNSFIADLQLQAVTIVRDTLDKFSATSPETMHTL